MTARIAMASEGSFSTRSVEQAEFVLGNTAIPYRSELVSSRELFATSISVRSGVATRVSRAKTRGRCRVHTAMPDDALALVVSRVGELPHICGGEEIVVSKDAAFVHSAGEEVKVLTPPEQQLYFLRVEQGHITTELEKLLDHPVTAPLQFSRKVSLQSLAGAEIANGVASLYHSIDTIRTEGSSDVVKIAAMENRLMQLLLESQRHNYTRILNRRAEIAPSQVRRAVEFIEANAQTALTLGEIAVAAGTNARTLQYGFQRIVGYSPLQYLRQFRLGQTRIALLGNLGSETVTEIAARWGFFHFGRFALEYGKAFGEKPSETLGRRKKIVRVA